MVLTETSELLTKNNQDLKTGLSVLFATVCVIDVFGVFPIIALQKAILNCGTYGILVLCSVITVQMYTATLLGKSWIIANNIDSRMQARSRCPYSALADVTCGRTVANYVTLLMNLTIFCAGVPNIIVASQNMELLGIRLASFELSYCYWMLIIGVFLCPILWLGSPKDMKCLCTVSAMIVVSVFLLVVMSLLHTKTEEIPQRDLQDSSYVENIIIAYGVISFQFDIHPTILTIQVDMARKAKISRAIIFGFLGTLTMFGFVYWFVYEKFGSNINESILESLPTSIYLHCAALLVAFQLGLSSAVGNTALYQQLEDCFGISRVFNQKRCILRSCLTVLAIILAESVPRFDLVMSLIGGTLTGPLIYILPPIFYVKMLHLKSYASDDLLLEDIIQDPSRVKDIHVKYGFSFINNYKTSIKMANFERFEFALCILIIIFGAFGTLATAYVNINNAYGFSNFSKPCIYNMTLF